MEAAKTLNAEGAEAVAAGRYVSAAGRGVVAEAFRQERVGRTGKERRAVRFAVRGFKSRPIQPERG